MKKSKQGILLLLSLTVSLLGIPAMLTSSTQYFISILLPINYTIVLAFFSIAVDGRKISVTATIFFAMGLLRYVVIPVLGSFTDYYAVDTKLLSEESLDTALILMLFELICAGLLLTFWECRKNRKNVKNLGEMSLYGTKTGYVLFILLAIGVYLAIGRNMDLRISFLLLSAGKGREYDTVNVMVSLVNLIISAALLFATVLMANNFKKKYDLLSACNDKNGKYVMYSILTALIPICIIFGERRVSVLNVAVAYIVLLVALYPKNKGAIIKGISLTASCVILLMTLYKTFEVFLHGSYEAAMSINKIDLSTISCQLDSYFYGIKTVARNVTFAEADKVNIFNAVYDVLRNTFGISFFMKGSLTTSEIFNMYKAGGAALTGTLFSSCGYAYCYLGYLGSFVDMFVKLLVMLGIENLIRKTEFYEWKYVWGYLYSVFAYFMFGSIVLQINSVTRFLFCYAVFIFFSSLFRNGKRNRSEYC